MAMAISTVSPAASAGKAHPAASADTRAYSPEQAPLTFWDRHGAATVARLGLRPGASVLDAGCGAGGVALAAARQVERNGHVIGVDLADAPLALARRKAAMQGLTNIDFVRADMQRLPFPDHCFDAVISEFSLFHAHNMARQVREFWRLVHPGGQLAIATWGPPVLPRPSAGTAMARVATPAGLADLMREGGATNVHARSTRALCLMPSATRPREASVSLNVVYAVAHKPLEHAA